MVVDRVDPDIMCLWRRDERRRTWDGSGVLYSGEMRGHLPGEDGAGGHLPGRNCTFPEGGLAGAGHPPVEDLVDGGREAGAVVEVADFADAFGLGGVGVDDVGELLEAHAALHGHGDLADHFAGVAGDDGRAENLVAALLDVNLDEALVVAVGAAAVGLADGLDEGVDLDALFLRARRVEAHVRDLRIGVGGPGDDEVGRLAVGDGEECVLQHDAGGGVGGVGELVLERDVAGGVDVGVGGLQLVVDGDAFGVGFDARGVQVQAVDVGRATDGEEDVVHLDGALFAVLRVGDALARGRAFDLLDAGAERKPDAFALKDLLQEGGGVFVLACHEARDDVEHNDFAAEAAEGLAHLGADGARADDGETGRQLCERKERFVGEIAALGEAGHGNLGRARAGGDEGLAELERLPGDLDGVRAGEASAAQVDVRAQVGEAVHGIVVAEFGADAAHAFHDGGEVDGDAVGHVNADRGGLADIADGFGGADEGLGGYAAGVEAVAAQEGLLDEGHLGAESDCAGDGDQACGAAADDDEVVRAAGRGVTPAAGCDLGDELLVELAPGGFDCDAGGGGGGSAVRGGGAVAVRAVQCVG